MVSKNWLTPQSMFPKKGPKQTNQPPFHNKISVDTLPSPMQASTTSLDHQQTRRNPTIHKRLRHHTHRLAQLTPANLLPLIAQPKSSMAPTNKHHITRIPWEITHMQPCTSYCIGNSQALGAHIHFGDCDPSSKLTGRTGLQRGQ